jgi:hypothetical protein
MKPNFPTLWRVLTLLLLASPVRAQTVQPPVPTLSIAPDHSLSTAEYVALGVASPTRTWSEVELRNSLQVLQKIADSDALKLPRFESAKSGAVFARLVTPVPLPRDVTSLEHFHRYIADLSGFAPPAGVLMLLYEKHAQGNLCFDAELVEVTRAALEINTRLLQAINRARAALDGKPAPDWLRREHTQVVWGAELTIRGALFIFSARQAFRPTWRERLGKDLEKWLPQLMAQMPEPAHAPAVAHLHGLMMEDPKGYADWAPVQQVMTFTAHGPPAFAGQKRAKATRRKKP